MYLHSIYIYITLKTIYEKINVKINLYNVELYKTKYLLNKKTAYKVTKMCTYIIEFHLVYVLSKCNNIKQIVLN